MTTKNFQESFETINLMLKEKGFNSLTENEAKSDWGIIGGETLLELSEMVNDVVSEMHTERCAEKDAWRYQH